MTWFRDAAYYARRDWRGRWATAGGGVLMNQAIHTLDLLQWFVGPVTDVRGTVATLALHDVIEVEDTAALRLQHGPDDNRVGSVFYATNGHHHRDHHGTRPPPLDTDLTVAHDDGGSRPSGLPPWRRESGPTGERPTAC